MKRVLFLACVGITLMSVTGCSPSGNKSTTIDRPTLTGMSAAVPRPRRL